MMKEYYLHLQRQLSYSFLSHRTREIEIQLKQHTKKKKKIFRCCQPILLLLVCWFFIFFLSKFLLYSQLSQDFFYFFSSFSFSTFRFSSDRDETILTKIDPLAMVINRKEEGYNGVLKVANRNCKNTRAIQPCVEYVQSWWSMSRSRHD